MLYTLPTKLKYTLVIARTPIKSEDEAIPSEREIASPRFTRGRNDVRIYMKKLLIISILFSILYSLFTVVPVFADVVCTPVYGGGQTCVSAGALLIDKKVLNPATNQFVDNLGVNDPHFKPLNPVFFRIALTNTGNTAVNNITVKDIIPQFVDFAAGAGNFDQNTKTLSFQLGSLAPSETRTFDLNGRTVSNDQLPSNLVCTVNQAIATSGNLSNQDNAQLCIEKVLPTPTPQPGQPAQPQQPVTKGGLPVLPPVQPKITPPTGPEAILTLLFATSGVSGIFLRKFSLKKN